MLATAPQTTFGHASPRIAPPRPLRSALDEFRLAAADLGIVLMPWQEVAATYITALGPNGLWLYPDIASVVSRQNGKTEMLLPFIVSRLRMGRRIMHTAQNRELPREVHGRAADFFESKEHRHELVKRPRFANGQEEIRTTGGGLYRIVAPTRGGARGPSNDDLIIDEIREMDDYAFIAAAKPTLGASKNPQTIYLSNAGDDTSIVLNDIRKRADEDPSLAYLEWSAGPERDASDREGWLESNPALGHLPGAWKNLEDNYRTYVLSGQSAIFETEHLCRWVPTMRPRLVDDFAWMRCRTGSLGAVRRPSLGISMDPSGTRASVVAAWRQEDGSIALRELFDVPGEPIDTDALGEDALKVSRRLGTTLVGYDDATDRDLARHWKKRAKNITGRDFANATEKFVRGVEGGTIRWTEAEHITADLASVSRKDNSENQTYHAVKSRDDTSVTAALAAIRAVWLVPTSSPGHLKVY
jgi:hypothetical protein